jgi:hypothetical protein
MSTAVRGSRRSITTGNASSPFAGAAHDSADGDIGFKH